ncbi:MAG TPA: BamA/TamA family outer membrane protein, partial [Polyangia bacterium]
ERAPDPRCQEPLDGREPAEGSVARRAGQVALAVPRAVTRAAFWPVVNTVDFLEYNRVIDRARAALTTDDGLVGVRPDLQYASSFLPSGGLRFFYRRLPGPGGELMTRVRTAGPAVFLGQVGVRGPDWLGLSLLASWDRRNDRLFAGIGAHDLTELAASGRGLGRYGSDDLAAELRWSRRLPGRLVAQAHGDLQRRAYRATDVVGGPSVATLYGLPAGDCPPAGADASTGSGGRCVDEMQVPGFGAGVRIAHLGGGLAVDLREDGRRRRGFRFVADGTLARGVAGDRSRHARISAEALVSVGSADHQLLFRGRGAAVEKLGSAPIPFDELVQPAGQDDMRGFAAGRLRGPSAVTGTAEYRWYISAFFDAALFVDVGTVAGPRFAGIDRERWFPSFGLGFRYYWIDGSYWEARPKEGIQIAYAPEGGFRFLFNMAAF